VLFRKTHDSSGSNGTKEDFKMKESPYGPCGIFCGACGAADCDGCLSENIDEYVEKCKFRNCTRERNVEFCCFCSDYPCAELHKFMNDEWPHHWTMKPNNEFIRKNGKEKWLQTQKQEWTCKNCSAEIKWYQNKCNCRQELDAWNLPESYSTKKE